MISGGCWMARRCSAREGRPDPPSARLGSLHSLPPVSDNTHVAPIRTYHSLLWRTTTRFSLSHLFLSSRLRPRRTRQVYFDSTPRDNIPISSQPSVCAASLPKPSNLRHHLMTPFRRSRDRHIPDFLYQLPLRTLYLAPIRSAHNDDRHVGGRYQTVLLLLPASCFIIVYIIFGE